jgi:hypothetical protein
MRDPMPTAAQAHVMLYLLRGLSPYTGRVGGDNRGGVLDSLWHACWIDGDDDLTWLGREALYRYLTRTFAGPVVAVAEQPIMFAYEARAMLAIVMGREFKASTEVLSHLSWLGWIDVAHGGVYSTAAGREALISYLLRDFNA